MPPSRGIFRPDTTGVAGRSAQGKLAPLDSDRPILQQINADVSPVVLENIFDVADDRGARRFRG